MVVLALGGRKVGKDQIHGVLWCSHQNCTPTWTLDLKAARNMRRVRVFLEILSIGGVLPAGLKHAAALDSARA